MDSYEGLVIALDNAAHNSNRARLHAADCVSLRSYNGKRGRYVISEDVAEHVAQLIEDQYPVTRCKCCREAK